MMLPVIRRLRDEGRLTLEVLALTTAREYLASHGIKSKGFRDLVTGADAQALAWGRELMEGQTHPSVETAESEAYLGLSFAELVEDLGLEGARQAFAHRRRAAFHPVRVLGRALKQWAPDLVVATSSPRAEAAALRAARVHGIPAVCLVDLFALEELKYIGQPGYADRICVLDEHVRARFLAAGRAAHEVVATGNPAFDSLADPALARQAAQWLAVQPWHERKKILWVSQPEPARHRITGEPGDTGLPRRVFEALSRLAARRPDWHLIVRPHPSEDATGFRPGLNVSISTQQEPLHMLLHAVDAVVCMTSTVGYEAALLGKPLIHLPLSVYRDEADYTQMGLALRCDTLEGLEKALNSILLGEWTPSLRLAPAGDATRAVCRVINGMLP
ncbi:MAG: hypothetical protein KF796_08095 [Ramlibacter sp.]|nr:hypothetical protein [Ramlibacter sp.]